jgi:hypothetical protein
VMTNGLLSLLFTKAVIKAKLLAFQNAPQRELYEQFPKFRIYLCALLI